MAKKGNNPTIKVVQTPAQREQIRRVLGREVAELELTAEALEERVAPYGSAITAVCGGQSAGCPMSAGPAC